MSNNEDKLVIGGHEFNSRFILGSGKFSIDLINAAVKNAGAEIVTLALRRAQGGMDNILDYIPNNVTLLPNTSGARNAEEAVRIAKIAREAGCGDFVKIEVIHDSKYLLPDNYETIKATEILAKEGFIVMPYMYPDLNAARDLVNAGAAAVMPLAAPIGTNKGLCTKDFIKILIDEIDLPIIVDAGIGAQYHSQSSGSYSPTCGWQETKQVYAIINRPTCQYPETYGHNIGYPCKLSRSLNSLTGFTVCDSNVDLNGIACTEMERQEIYNALTSGVYL